MFRAGALLQRIDDFARRHSGPPGPTSAIVVLGARVSREGRASPALERRMRLAIALFHQGLAPKLVFTGGSEPGTPPEAEVMRALALAHGVPPGAMVLEPHSRSTVENARFTAPILRTHAIDELALVTDDFHLLRGATLFRLQGLTVLPVSAGGPVRTVDAYAARLRELAAFLRHPALMKAALED